jgi:hypothetical protein
MEGEVCVMMGTLAMVRLREWREPPGVSAGASE